MEVNQAVTLQDIELAVAKRRDGRLDVPGRLKQLDPSLGEELVLLALYDAFKRHGSSHAEALQGTQQMMSAATVKVIYG
jgi:hypothetical protein